ncbi:flagellar type III secretion system protein FlhB [Burkholderia cenocepacia]|uniref:Type III secretion exporter n=1 Tax=Burkholderia orbicola (strain MC0-3) TaxID=406425 RepID=B1K591_BURO0|nr:MULTISPECIES: EscU/YscU/HrcU family type III secretion system export apparatus switch protein [Burkholderia cepacia complex]ACA95053.1 type III secretion exporter [Burkholderia orbicola MC0-3]MBR8157597.1 EscU/YscU/HrcU family type III secretion system export apparatus switch protein [Burkholderia cenocepacia]MBR8415474.1 EscU/YscU/HrcU family type III secretion system export apparatus switch protein [Burkholderia cenocepacia]MCA7922182.1 EscU/YscU/HrcU family type III secretion system expor
MSDEKTEQPTRRKLKEARKKGTVAKSVDLVAAVLVLVSLALFTFAWHPLLDALHQNISRAIDFCGSERSMHTLWSVLMHELANGAIACCAISVAAALAAALSIGAQVGLQVSFDPVMPKMDRLSPAAGLKQIFSKRALIDLLKMSVKAVVIAAALWHVIVSLFPLITSAMAEPLAALSQILWHALLKLLFAAAVLFLVVGVVDWKIQHWLMMRAQRMSKDEVKRELKEREGEPKLKHERRKRAKELVNGGGESLSGAVGRANVVVVNPTHYAVALRYVRGETPLPVVLAKGIDDAAREIRALATQRGVPIVANPPVARALYEVAEHRPIPSELFEVVAAILRWVEAVGPGTPAAEPR